MINRLSHLLWAGMKGFLRIGIPLLLMGITGIVIDIYDPAILNSIIETIQHHPINYLLFRWVVLISFVLCWPYIATKIGQQRNATAQQILCWRGEIWRIAFWLILIEIVICENLVGKSIHLLGGF